MSVEKIIEKNIGLELEDRYLDYAMSVIVGRAIPDVRDGLKPVHRRIIFSMYQNRHFFNQPFVKCARIVGDCLGKYHPHGDMAVYNSLVRMAQDFSLRYPLIWPQGNFGSIDGDDPAAYRYTEARLAQISNELIEDIDKETVEFVPNFDDSLKEPKFLPSKLPNLLINGTNGIAVGMSTNMAPHNLSEVCNGIIAKIDNPDISLEVLQTHILAPDFPTGGIIIDPRGVTEAFKTGRGKIVVRGKVDVETSKENKRSMIISEIPYMVNKTTLIQSIAKLIQDKNLKDIKDLRDESDREGMRIVLELNTNAVPELIENILYKRTKLQDSFNIINLTLVPKLDEAGHEHLQPKIMTLQQLIDEYLKHREQIIYKRTVFELTKTKAKHHKIEGLLIALNDIDNVILLIKGSKDSSEASIKLIKKYKLTKIQADAILSMQLSRLTSLESQKLVDEKNNLVKKVVELEKIIASEKIRFEIIKQELKELSQNFGNPRRTQIIDLSDEKDIERKDLIKVESMIVMLTEDQYIKRVPTGTWQTQGRGGKGKKIMKSGEEDFLRDIFSCLTHDNILFFTSKGRVYSLHCYDIPSHARTAKGRSINRILNLKEDEKIAHMIPISKFSEQDTLVFVTKKGIVKRTLLGEYGNIHKGGIIAIKIRENDELISVLVLGKDPKDIFVGTTGGYAARFDVRAIKKTNRDTMGVKGIKLREGDNVIEAQLTDKETIIFTLTKKGVAKRTPVTEYRKTAKNRLGVININFKDDEDEVIAIRIPIKGEDLLIGTKLGLLIRINVDSIRETHRVTQGVIAIKINPEDEVVSIGKCEEVLTDLK